MRKLMTYSIITHVNVYFSVFINCLGAAVNFVAMVNIGAGGGVGAVRYIDEDIEMGEVDDYVETGEVDDNVEMGDADKDIEMGVDENDENCL